MTDKLTGMLLDSLDKESRRFADQHRGDETSLYERAIGPRRRHRRIAQAAGGVAAVGVVALGAYGFVVPHGDDAVSNPSSNLEIERRARDWEPPADLQADGSAAGLIETWGIAPDVAPACATLDELARLEGLPWLGGEPVAVGAVGAEDAAVGGVTARGFASAEDGRAYLEAIDRAAAGCREQGAQAGIEVEARDLGIGAVPGDGVRVDVTGGAADGAWVAWVHLDGDEAVAVVAEPGAEDLAAPIIAAWFTAAAG
ncbi:hypothetical protein [Demequina rhizosphaerae]|uniref:hypothetical protein n=1 Tax=Demequina rhizosphaerae TaxID=1638985 RepID=UPI0007821943|nr:hypothetical protein [Demequina rhizosphaerae]